MRRVVLALLAASFVVAGAADSALKQQVTGLFREKKWSEAQAILEKATATAPGNAEAWYYLGESFLYRDQGENAVPPLEKAVALAPASSEYQRHLGDAYGLSAQQAGFFSKTGWARKCKVAYETAVRLDPGNLKARESLLEFYRQAPGFAGGGMDLAYAEAGEIQKLDPRRGRLAFGTLYASEEKYPEAFNMYGEILRSSPDEYAALYQYGRIAAVSGQRLDAGLAALRKCLALTPPPGQPTAAPVHWRIGNILERQGDKPAARAAYRAALQADPNFTRAADALAKLQ